LSQPSLQEIAQESTEKSVGLLRLSQKAVALIFGPENGAVSERFIFEAAREARAKDYSQLFVFGFAIEPNARMLIESATEVMGIPATYVQATQDLLMGDLLKNMRSSQIFSVCGLPDISVHPRLVEGGRTEFTVSLEGLDTFDPITMETVHVSGDDVPAWFLDTDYNGLCFHISQAFFPRTSAWEAIRHSLQAEFDDSVWAHLAGASSAPFEAGDHRQVAVKVIDDRGNELIVVRSLEDAK